AVLSDYPVSRYLLATALGRFPRLWVIAALGMTLGLPAWALGTAIGFSLVFATMLWVIHRRSRPAQPLATAGPLVPPTPMPA
ncbi:MAG: hypothetical protein WD043_00060, partial [Gemmatimonadales bacterium]